MTVAPSNKILKLFRESMIVILGHGLSMIGGLIGIRLLTGVMSPNDFGTLSIYLSIAMVAQIVVGESLQAAFMRFYATAMEQLHHDVFRQLIQKGILIAFGFAILLAGATWGFRHTFEVEVGWLQILAIGLMAFLGCGLNIFIGVQSAARNRGLVAALQVVMEWGRFSLAIVYLVFIANTAVSALFGYVTAAFIVFLLHLIFTQTRLGNLHKTYDAGTTNELKLGPRFFAYWRALLLCGLFNWILLFADRWALMYFQSMEEVGLYSALYRIGYAPALVGSAFLTMLLAPILFQKAGDTSNRQRISSVVSMNEKMIGVIGLAGLFGFGCIFFLRHHIGALLLGASFQSISSLLPWVVLAGALYAIGQQVLLSVCCHLKERYLVMLKFGCALVAVVLHSVGAVHWSVNGVVVAGLIFSVIHLGWAIGLHVWLKQDVE